MKVSFTNNVYENKQLLCCRFLGSKGKVAWTGNWVSYIDTLLQFELISIKTRELRLPTYIEEVIIDPVYHKEVVKGLSNTKGNTYQQRVECIQ